MQNKVAIILWLYHTDLAEEFKDLLLPHKDSISIFLGLCKDHDSSLAESIFKDNFDNINVSYYKNGGTDILPTLNLLEKAQKYPLFFKLHTKKNGWGNKKQVNWRVLLSNDIVYKDNFKHTINMLERTEVGIVGSKSFIMRNNEYTNHDKIVELCSILNIDYERLRIKSFIGGNVFASKTKLFEIFWTNKKVKELLSKEIGHIKDDKNGTYVHSMERLFGYIAEYNNKNILGVPKSSSIILNPNIKQHRLHLVRLYNNDCYIQENPNIYGKILQDTQEHTVIQWFHLDIAEQKYIKHQNFLVNNNVKSKRST